MENLNRHDDSPARRDLPTLPELRIRAQRDGALDRGERAALEAYARYKAGACGPTPEAVQRLRESAKVRREPPS